MKHENNFTFLGTVHKVFPKVSKGGKNFLYVTIRTSIRFSAKVINNTYHTVIMWEGPKWKLEEVQEGKTCKFAGHLDYQKIPRPDGGNNYKPVFKVDNFEDYGFVAPPIDGNVDVPEATDDDSSAF